MPKWRIQFSSSNIGKHWTIRAGTTTVLMAGHTGTVSTTTAVPTEWLSPWTRGLWPPMGGWKPAVLYGYYRFFLWWWAGRRILDCRKIGQPLRSCRCHQIKYHQGSRTFDSGTDGAWPYRPGTFPPQTLTYRVVIKNRSDLLLRFWHFQFRKPGQIHICARRRR